MKLVKTASGKQTIKMSRKEWTSIGKKAGWMKKADLYSEEEVTRSQRSALNRVWSSIFKLLDMNEKSNFLDAESLSLFDSAKERCSAIANEMDNSSDFNPLYDDDPSDFIGR